MRRTTAALVLVLLAAALAAPPARAQGRCKAGEEEDPQTGKCRPISSSEEGSGKRRGGGSKTSEEEEEAQLRRESCELRCKQNHVNCRDEASKCDQTHTLCMDLCWKEYLANLPAASRARRRCRRFPTCRSRWSASRRFRASNGSGAAMPSTRLSPGPASCAAGETATAMHSWPRAAPGTRTSHTAPEFPAACPGRPPRTAVPTVPTVQS